ncbi:unnamed protein product [Effrenium voratum]|uniref:Uncharacterized protein n=1 Tax=Effrenium voratum TaxID=2562239 RepID=A0AA36HSN0_9DINO|nr:unnamed protein product [Effrenium voratum]
MHLLGGLRRFCACSEERKVSSPRDGIWVQPGQDGWYLAGFKGHFPEVPCGWEAIEPPLCGAVEQLAETNKDLARYLFNNVKVCAQCLRACAHSQRACQACGTQLGAVPVTQTENVLMGFIFGVERTSKFPLVISLRRQSTEAIVYDDLLAMSSCHLNALPTNHYVPDWKWLLRDPKGAKQLINILVQEAWEATRSFLEHAEWRSFIYREGVTEEMIRQNIMCGFNSPPSQSQLHLQWIVLPLLPFHHQKLLDRTHAQKGRWFPLEYVLPILDLLEEEEKVFEVNTFTTAEDIISFFNGKGIVYNDVWEQSYARYCRSYEVANWKPKDFSYVVREGNVHEITEVRGGVLLAGKVAIEPCSLQAEDKLRLQNYGRKYSDGKPGGTYYKHHKAAKIGAGGIQIWPGIEILCD